MRLLKCLAIISCSVAAGMDIMAGNFVLAAVLLILAGLNITFLVQGSHD